MAQCVPVPRQALQLALETLDAMAQERLGETQEELFQPGGSYRSRFRQKKL